MSRLPINLSDSGQIILTGNHEITSHGVLSKLRLESSQEDLTLHTHILDEFYYSLNIVGVKVSSNFIKEVERTWTDGLEGQSNTN